MPDDELDAILIQVTVPLPIPMIYAAFTEPDKLTGWLCDSADVDPKVGGRFRLGWTSDPAFESTGTILQMQRDVDIGFSWSGPPAFETLMNGDPPKTRVYVRLAESPEGIDITLEHSGWGSGDEWQEARSWHFHFWDERLHGLKDYLIKAAYG
ncbi:MAG TPA: SRPBCC domain-containing protein [Thermoplasmata archaeon]|nr:SRPBCC domain-containing protein [Thermoplasmata archaeon]